MQTEAYWRLQWEISMAQMTRSPDALIHDELLAKQAEMRR